VEQAKAAAGDKDVQIVGGANAVQQSIKAGLLDELQIHLASVLLGDGVRLFERMGPEDAELEGTRVIDSPRVTHLRFRVVIVVGCLGTGQVGSTPVATAYSPTFG
jgi:dihydrofolate reductase